MSVQKKKSEGIRLKPLDSFLPSPTITPNPTENKSPPIQKSQRTPKPKAPDLEERKRRAREYLNSNS